MTIFRDYKTWLAVSAMSRRGCRREFSIATTFPSKLIQSYIKSMALTQISTHDYRARAHALDFHVCKDNKLDHIPYSLAIHFYAPSITCFASYLPLTIFL
jgi:hypothetical protein